jgi:hypothetical protein
MMIPPCSMSAWKSLYAAADAFRDTACWEWMSDSDVFGVQNPHNGEIGYCCVLGALGEVCGLVVYLGSAGLEQHRKIQSGKVRAGSPEVAYNQTCLAAWFGKQRDLDQIDLKVIKYLGLKYRGDIWPLFRSMQPGYLPWYLTDADAKFLTLCLTHARQTAHRFGEDPSYLKAPGKNRYLVHVSLRTASPRPRARSSDASLPSRQPSLFPEPVEPPDFEWEARWLSPALPVKTAVKPFPIDEVRSQRIKKSSRGAGGVWKIDAFFLPAPVAEGDRPYFPYTLLCADGRSGFILATVLAKPSDWEVEFPKTILDGIESHKLLPAKLAFRKDELRELFGPLASQLGIEVESAKKLPAVDRARRELSKFMGQRR